MECNFSKQKCKFWRVQCKLCVSVNHREPPNFDANHLIYSYNCFVVCTVILLLLYRLIYLFSIFIKILLLLLLRSSSVVYTIIQYIHFLLSCYVRGNNIYFISSNLTINKVGIFQPTYLVILTLILTSFFPSSFAFGLLFL